MAGLKDYIKTNTDSGTTPSPTDIPNGGILIDAWNHQILSKDKDGNLFGYSKAEMDTKISADSFASIDGKVGGTIKTRLSGSTLYMTC